MTQNGNSAETHRWLALYQNLEQLDRFGAEETRAEVRLIDGTGNRYDLTKSKLRVSAS
jgi:hypothetical protein